MATFKLDKGYGQNTAEIMLGLRLHSGQIQKDTAIYCIEKFDPPVTPEKIRAFIRMVKAIEHSEKRPDVVETAMLLNAYGADFLGYLVALYTGDYRIALMMADTQIGNEMLRQLGQLYEDHGEEFDKIRTPMIRHLFEHLSKQLGDMLARDREKGDVYRLRPSPIRPWVEQAVKQRRHKYPKKRTFPTFRNLIDEYVR